MEKICPVTIWLKTVSNSVHWHENECELILVLQGSVEVKNYCYTFTVHENQMIFINRTEIHKITCLEEDSKYVVIHLDVLEFNQFLPGASKVFFLRDPNDMGKEAQLIAIRKHIAGIFIELKYKNNGYIKRVTHIGRSILEILQSEFNYLYKSKNSFRSEEQFERIWEIFDYILENYSRRISLEEIANHVHLSKSYLSHNMKETTGMTLEQWFNAYRLEAAMRLLVSTELSLTRISYESGFSDPKYFIKTFKEYFGMTPTRYKEIEGSDKGREMADDADYFADPVFNTKLCAFPLDRNKLDCGSREKQLIHLDFDGSAKGKPFARTWDECLSAGRLEDLEEGGSVLCRIGEIQRKIGFQYVKFSVEGAERPNFSWGKLYSVLDRILENCGTPMIEIAEGTCSKQNSHTAGIVREKCERNYGGALTENWAVSAKPYGKNVSKPGHEEKKHLLYDTMYGAILFIYEATKERRRGEQPIADVYCEEGICGDKGLFTCFGLKKPLFFAYELLSLLGEEVLMTGEQYMVTRSGGEIQILIFNLAQNIHQIPMETLELNFENRNQLFNLESAMDVVVTLKLPRQQYKMKRYMLGGEWADTLEGISDARVLQFLTEQDKALLNSCHGLTVKYDYMPCNGKITLIGSLEANSAELILLREA